MLFIIFKYHDKFIIAKNKNEEVSKYLLFLLIYEKNKKIKCLDFLKYTTKNSKKEK